MVIAPPPSFYPTITVSYIYVLRYMRDIGDKRGAAIGCNGVTLMPLQQDIEHAAKRLVMAHHITIFEKEAAALIAILNNNDFTDVNSLKHVRLTIQRVAINSGLSNSNIIWHRLRRLYDI